METDATRMCALLVGLPDVMVVGVGDWPLGLRVTVTMDSERPTCSCRGAVIATGSARSCWSISRCSVARRGWCGGSNGGVVRTVVAAGATTIPRSRRLGAG